MKVNREKDPFFGVAYHKIKTNIIDFKNEALRATVNAKKMDFEYDPIYKKMFEEKPKGNMGFSRLAKIGATAIGAAAIAGYTFKTLHNKGKFFTGSLDKSFSMTGKTGLEPTNLGLATEGLRFRSLTKRKLV